MEAKKPSSFVQNAISAALAEKSITKGLLGDNLTAHCGIALTSFSIRLHYLSVVPEQLKSLLPDMVLAIIAFAYTFDIANQAFSVDEDLINKPHRPIPSGQMSQEGAYIRWALSWLLFPTVIYMNVGPVAATLLLSWEAWTFLFYVWPKFDNWIARNAFTAVGAVVQLRLIDAVLAHHVPTIQNGSSLSYVIFSWLFMTIHIQEFHDIEGDKNAGRQTLPLLLSSRGQVWLRVGTAVMMIMAALASVTLTGHRCSSMHSVCFLGLCLLVSTLALSVRLVKLRHKEADKITYKYFYFLSTYLMFFFHAHVEARSG
ncbi:hypothetical protein N7451_006408 [Penicillium sp. IBT 35674x]|nr:hypothetical protein N7451_006408 [Penicillium sp. IBT 35674x]